MKLHIIWISEINITGYFKTLHFYLYLNKFIVIFINTDIEERLLTFYSFYRTRSNSAVVLGTDEIIIIEIYIILDL